MDATTDAAGAPIGTAHGGTPAPITRTLIFANDKSSGKTTAANAVLVSLLVNHADRLHSVSVHEYDRQPRLSEIFSTADGFGAVVHHDARNAAAYDASRALAYDPNASVWDELLFVLGTGGVVVDLGANMFADICRILDDEPRPIFPDAGESVGVCVPVTTARDSIDGGMFAIDQVLGWGKQLHVFVIEQEYLGRFTDGPDEWTAYRDRLLAHEADRVHVVRVPRLAVADIGRVMYKRIDRLVADAGKRLKAGGLQGADYIRAIREARTELAWGSATLDVVKPIADWLAG